MRKKRQKQLLKVANRSIKEHANIALDDGQIFIIVELDKIEDDLADYIMHNWNAIPERTSLREWIKENILTFSNRKIDWLLDVPIS